MTELKPALTYKEQINRLKDAHNLTITDDSEAMEILRRVNYYRLSAYGIGLKQKDNNELYLDGISLSHLYKLYHFDSLFKNLLVLIIEQLEIQLRTQISHHLALTYGPEGYVDPSIFTEKKTKDGRYVHDIIIESFHKECEHQKNSPFVKHHMDKYEGHFPIWVAVELFTFGNLSSMYDIMKKDDRKTIAKFYNTEPRYLGSWLLALVEIRNICAHYSRLYNMPLKQTPHLYSDYQKYRSSTLNKVFPVLLCIKRMLNNDDRWHSYETQLEKLMDDYKEVINLSFMGFPPEWREILKSDMIQF